MKNSNTRRGNTQPENAVVKQSVIAELVSPSSTYAVTQVPGKQQEWKTLKQVQGLCLFDKNREAGDPRLRASGMTPLFNTPLPRLTAVLSPQGGQKTARGFTIRPSSSRPCGRVGFTLIELLVVVLIIGILAAVALPQYNKAVNKSHGTEALNAIHALDEALHAYYLEHGTYEGANADTLNIQIPDLDFFEYVNTGATSSSASFQVGCRVSESSYEMALVLQPRGPRVYSYWEQGKFINSYCSGFSAYDTNCSKYFNCRMETSQVGTSTFTRCHILY